MFYCEKPRVLTNSPAEQPRVASEEQLTAAEKNQDVQLQAAETIQNVQLQAAETDYSTLSPDAQEAMLPVEVFLSESYEFRFNVLSNKIEVRARKAGSSWRYVDKKTLNSIVVAARRALPKERALKTLVADVIYSDATPEWNPAVAWLQSLPRWDGIERLSNLFMRLPGITSVKVCQLRVWLLSVVAHWLQMEALHANECVPVLIGDQGCGKSTFWLRLLPPHLREFYLDHVNFGCKFDKEMALTNNLLVNLDELDQVRRSQQSELKQMISKVRVNGRTIFAGEQYDRSRYASFVATTNNQHPLRDVTGSRRYLCISITPGREIDNVSEIDYEQIFAQVLHDLKGGARYWFNADELRGIQRENLRYQSVFNYEAIIEDCFRHPAEGEQVEALSASRIRNMIARKYPQLPNTHSTSVNLGLALSRLSYPFKVSGNNRLYFAVPRKA